MGREEYQCLVRRQVERDTVEQKTSAVALAYTPEGMCWGGGGRWGPCSTELGGLVGWAGVGTFRSLGFLISVLMSRGVLSS